jgi:hypothetical protein
LCRRTSLGSFRRHGPRRTGKGTEKVVATLQYRAAARATIVALATIAAACSNTPSATSPGATSRTPNGAFAQCLTAHGVPAPPEGQPPVGAPPPGSGPSGGASPSGTAPPTPPAPPGVDQGVWESALQACSSLAPTPPSGAGPAPNDAFGQCLTAHGVPAPPPGRPPGGMPPPASPSGTERPTPPAPPGVDQQTWNSAFAACSSLAPPPPTQ